MDHHVSRSFPTPTRKDHQAFCLIEQWTEVRNTRGKTSHHITYELPLPDGTVLRTRISRPPGRKTYGKAIWSHILRDQLVVSEQEFWECVRDRVLPARSRPTPERETTPAGVISQLLSHGVPESEIRDMSRAEAIDRLTRIWSEE